MGEIDEQSEIGHLFENFILQILKEKIKFTNSSIHFWRTKDRAEVDFVIRAGNEIIPIEVKYKNFKEIKLERSLRNFIKAYNPKKAFVINKNLEDKIKIKNTEISFLPFWKVVDYLDI